MNPVVRHLRRAALLGDNGGPTDGQLLECFLSRRDDAAFETLVRRHGPMVLGVCRRVLRNAHDAEDAFQATFLVLARKAASVRPRELVGHWLHGVAYRTALKARGTIARRHTKEEQARAMARIPPSADEAWDELLPLLDQELNRLPEKYRVPVVLCDLEGKRRKDVARHLKVPEGTVASRLAAARKLLARRLARYGPALSGGAVAALLAEKGTAAAVPRALLVGTGRAAARVAAGQALAAGAVSARVAALTEGVVKTMLLSKLRVLGAVALFVLVGTGAVGLSYRTGAAEPRPSAAAAAAADELDALRLEIEALRKD